MGFQKNHDWHCSPQTIVKNRRLWAVVFKKVFQVEQYLCFIKGSTLWAAILTDVASDVRDKSLSSFQYEDLA